jgi:hypothetical protein
VKIETALSALLYLILTMSSAPTWASSEAGFDATFGSLRVRVLYSVAVDYDNGADTCIRNPSCLLYDVVEFFQAHLPESNPRQEVLQFELYQSTKKEGNYLSLIRDPF